MRFSYAESMVDPALYQPLAQAVEEAGYDGMVVPDSVVYPEHSDARYPFSPDGRREFLEGKPFIDPFVLIAAMGAATRRIRFITYVLKLPIRHPVLVAKQATSAAVITGGRLVLGVGSSPWPDDYRALGVPWEGRGRRMDESIRVLRGLSGGEYFEMKGEVYDIPSIKIAPVPESPIPILIGGHSDAALRRAVRLGDGWLHGGGDPADLPVMLKRLETLRAEYPGETAKPFEIHAITADAYTPDGVRRLEEMGVTDLIVGFRWPYTTEPDREALHDKISNLQRYANDVIDKVR